MLFQTQVETIVEEVFCEDPKEAMVAYRVLKSLKENEYDKELVNTVFQEVKNRYTIVDAFYFAKVYAGIVKGEILIGIINLGESPSADKEIVENCEKLKSLPSNYSVNIAPGDGSGYNTDGVFSWEESVQLYQMNTSGEKELVLVDPLSIPLEIGCTEAFTTFNHLYTYGIGVARWAYESNKIFIMVKKGC